MVQRVLSARSIDHGRKGVLLVGALYLFTLFIFILPGLIGRGINLFGVENLPDQVISGTTLKSQYGINTDQVYPRLIMRLLPVGFIGLILAAMISALTAALSATIGSVASLFTMDFYTRINLKGRRKEAGTGGADHFAGRIAFCHMLGTSDSEVRFSGFLLSGDRFVSGSSNCGNIFSGIILEAFEWERCIFRVDFRFGNCFCADGC